MSGGVGVVEATPQDLFARMGEGEGAGASLCWSGRSSLRRLLGGESLPETDEHEEDEELLLRERQLRSAESGWTSFYSSSWRSEASC